MMRAPDCHDHGRLVLDLAQGRLDDTQAVRAEEIRRDCPTCRAWWEAAFRGSAHAGVDAEVAGVFAAFEAPRRRSVHTWWAAAAAAVVVLGIGALTLLGPGPAPTSADLAPETAQLGEPISTIDFESGVAPVQGAEASGELFRADFESGDASLLWVPST